MPDDNTWNRLATDVSSQIHSVSQSIAGQGGLADVYTAIWNSPAEGPIDVALKRIRVTTPDDKLVKHLKREIFIWESLSHENVIRLIGLYTSQEWRVPAMVSPWYPNGDINHYLRTRPPNLVHEDVLKLQLLIQVLHGVDFLHKKKIIHGDIKGGNVLISNAGVAQLSDFGFSIAIAQHTRSSYMNARGTWRWMSPELFTDSARHTYESDIWACGCLFVEILLGIVPYAAYPAGYQVMSAIVMGKPMAAQDIMMGYRWLIIAECCNVDVQKRLPVSAIIERLRILLLIALVELHPDDCDDISWNFGIEATMTSTRRSLSHPLTSLHRYTDNALYELTTKASHHKLLLTRQIAEINSCYSLCNALASRRADDPLFPNTEEDDALHSVADRLFKLVQVLSPNPHSPEFVEGPLVRLLRSVGNLDDLSIRAEHLDKASAELRHDQGYFAIYTARFQNKSSTINVAIKAYRDSAHSVTDKIRFALRRWILMCNRLNHPNILPLFGVTYLSGPLPAVVSPWCTNGAIDIYLQANKVTRMTKTQMLVQVLEGLQYLHKNGVIHAHIQSGNVLVTADGNIQLCNFGVMKPEFDDPESSAVSRCARYLAPELVGQPQPLYTTQSDIWAFGCLMIETYSGYKPYNEINFDDAVKRTLSKNRLPRRPFDIVDYEWLLFLQCCTIDQKSRISVESSLNRLQGHLDKYARAKTDTIWKDDVRSAITSAENILRESNPIKYTDNAIGMLAAMKPDITPEPDSPTTNCLTHLLQVCIETATLLAQDPLFPDIASTSGLHSIALTVISIFNAWSILPDTEFRSVPQDIEALSRLLSTTDNDAVSFLQKMTNGICRLGHIEVSRNDVIAWETTSDRLFASSSVPSSKIHEFDAVNLNEIASPKQLPHTDASILAISADGRFVAFLASEKLWLWLVDRRDIDPQELLDDVRGLHNMSFSSDGSLVASGSPDYLLRVWRTQTGELVDTYTILQVGRLPVSTRTYVSFSPTMQRLVVVTSNGTRISVWDESESLRFIPINDPLASVEAVALSPDGNSICAISKKVGRVWSVDSGLKLFELEHGGLSVVFSHDANYIVTGDRNGCLRIWNARSGVFLSTPPQIHASSVRTIAFAPNNRNFASMDDDGEVIMWNTEAVM